MHRLGAPQRVRFYGDWIFLAGYGGGGAGTSYGNGRVEGTPETIPPADEALLKETSGDQQARIGSGRVSRG